MYNSWMTNSSRAGLGVAIALTSLSLATPTAQSRRAINVHDLLSLQRISDPRISPDGALVAYTVSTPDREANRLARNIWVVPTKGGEPRQLTTSGKDGGARWSPDGKRLAFLSTRGGESQIYLIALVGGEATPLTSLSGGADQMVWSPDGTSIAFSSRVYADCKDDACNATTREATRTEQGEGARCRPAPLSPLDAMERRPARSSVRRAGCRRYAEGPHARCRLRRAAGAARGSAPDRVLSGRKGARLRGGHRPDGSRQHEW